MISFHEGKIISKKKNKPKYQNNKSDFGRLRNREAKQKPSRNSVLFICLRQGHLLSYSLRSQALTFFSCKIITHFTFPCAKLLFSVIAFNPSKKKKILLLELHEKIKLYLKGEEQQHSLARWNDFKPKGDIMPA